MSPLIDTSVNLFIFLARVLGVEDVAVLELDIANELALELQCVADVREAPLDRTSLTSN